MMPTLLADAIFAVAVLGLPVALISWFVFDWLFRSTGLDREGDRKTLAARVRKAKKKIARQERSNARYVYDKWMLFGSGFYGLAGLWTFALIEVRQFAEFLVDFPGWGELLRDGLVGLVVSFLIGQLGNILQGLFWFSWWPAQSVVVWILVAYLGYWSGVELARRGVTLTRTDVQ